jgi:type II secretory pathway component GspD/PulD (secretin)
MMPVIEAIDKPTPQIQIKANIVETTKETARLLGWSIANVKVRSFRSRNKLRQLLSKGLKDERRRK